jgi:hypothetical protein
MLLLLLLFASNKLSKPTQNMIVKMRLQIGKYFSMMMKVLGTGVIKSLLCAIED